MLFTITSEYAARVMYPLQKVTSEIHEKQEEEEEIMKQLSATIIFLPFESSSM
jgi:hypothetical protein